MAMQFQDFDSYYLDRLGSGDFSTQQHFVAYFGELIRLKAGKRLRSIAAIEDVRQETLTVSCGFSPNNVSINRNASGPSSILCATTYYMSIIDCGAERFRLTPELSMPFPIQLLMSPKPLPSGKCNKGFGRFSTNSRKRIVAC